MKQSKVISSCVSLILILNAIKASRVDNATYKIKFRSLLLKVARSEIGENVQYDQVTKSLLDFLKLQKSIGIETDFTADQVIELVNIFQRILKMKISLLEGLLGVWSQLCDSEAVHEDEINDVMGQIVCLNEFSTFVNLNVVAERLSSPKLEMIVDAIEYLLPYTKEYSRKLDVCDEKAALILNDAI